MNIRRRKAGDIYRPVATVRRTVDGVPEVITIGGMAYQRLWGQFSSVETKLHRTLKHELNEELKRVLPSSASTGGRADLQSIISHLDNMVDQVHRMSKSRRDPHPKIDRLLIEMRNTLALLDPREGKRHGR